MPIAQDTRYGPFATLLAPDDQELGRTLTGPGFELAEPVHALGDCPKVFDRVHAQSTRNELTPEVAANVLLSVREHPPFCSR